MISVGTVLGWLGVNKFLVLAAVGGVVVAGGVYLWKDAQVSDAKAALANQQRDIAVEAATTNANTSEMLRRMSRISGEIIAKQQAESQALQNNLTARLMEINNASPAPVCPPDPVLDDTFKRVWGQRKNTGPDNQGPIRLNQQVPAR